MKNFKLKRVWAEASLLKGTVIKITAKDKLHHLNTVLKIRFGESIRLFNESDGEWLGLIQEKNNKAIVIKIKEQLRQPKSGNNIAIAFAPIKHDRLRFLIEKCTEIGATKFIPVITERTVTRNINLTKLHTYAVGAAEQSERLSIPDIKDSILLKSFLEQYNADHILFCNERSDSKFINEALQKFPRNCRLIILIGPEGGFSVQERDSLASHNNIHPVSLGENILRAETAAIFALTCAISITKK
jgi:16S rRNA (uracil1498-N3)-methyltransferase